MDAEVLDPAAAWRGPFPIEVDHALQEADGLHQVQVLLDLHPGGGTAADRETTVPWAVPPEESAASFARHLDRALEYRSGAPWHAVLHRFRGTAPAPGEQVHDRLLEETAELAAGEAEQALAEGRAPRPIGWCNRPAPPALPHPLRQLHVLSRAKCCGGLHAEARLDLEPPGPDQEEDLRLIVDLLPEQRLPRGMELDPQTWEEFIAAFAYGLKRGWRQAGGGRAPYAMRAVLREVGWHDVDSGPYGFKRIGELAVLKALHHFGPPSTPGRF
ncbi:hypothetical protein J0910_30370 [Nocardiopsis sp. CNT-189]|uniref:hypothetical protein n=1 Tax=Nocardiopsis oceanisediminis TaxID=2816862 RepID=UPI003B2E8603